MRESFAIILHNLDYREKTKLIYLIILFFLGTLFELIGIGSIIPLLTLIIQGEIEFRNFLMDYNLDFFNKYSFNELIIVLLLTVLLIYFVKTIFLTFMTWYQNDTLFKLIAKFSSKIYSYYLDMNYYKFTQNNTSVIFKNIVVETERLVTGFLTPLAFILTELFVILGISLLLLIYEPIGFLLSITSVTIVGLIFSFSTRKLIISLGEKRIKFQGLRFKTLNEGLDLFKLIKVSNSSKFFHKNFSNLTTNETKTQSLIYTITQLPKFWVEFFAVIGVLVLFSFTISVTNNSQDLLLIVGVFTICAFRLIPSLNRILLSFQNMRASYASVKLVSSELSMIRNFNSHINGIEKMEFNNFLNINNINFRHYGKSDLLFNNFSLSIKKNQCLGLKGPSGSGKSTLIDLITGLLTPESGQILADEKNIFSNLKGWRKNIGIVHQNVVLIDDSIRTNIAFGVSDKEISNENLNKAIKLAQLENFIDSLPEKINSRVGDRGVLISGGQLQRIGIARALYNNPDLIILDEATSSLDAITERSFIESIKNIKGKKTIIMISHKDETLSICDQIIEFN